MFNINQEQQTPTFTLPNNPVFGDLLSSRERTYLVKNSHVRQVSVGEILCEKNKLENVLYIILTGEVKISEVTEGKNINIGVLHSGNLVGEIGALFAVPRIATVTATKAAVVLEIEANTFLELIRKTPMLYSAVYQRLFERSLETALCSRPVFGQLSNQTRPDLSHLLQCRKTNIH